MGVGRPLRGEVAGPGVSVTPRAGEEGVLPLHLGWPRGWLGSFPCTGGGRGTTWWARRGWERFPLALGMGADPGVRRLRWLGGGG